LCDSCQENPLLVCMAPSMPTRCETAHKMASGGRVVRCGGAGLLQAGGNVHVRQAIFLPTISGSTDTSSLAHTKDPTVPVARIAILPLSSPTDPLGNSRCPASTQQLVCTWGSTQQLSLQLKKGIEIVCAHTID
jgi:hypothetical protein